MNWSARQNAYAVRESKRHDRIIPAENWMFTSGAVVLGFIILHLADFTFELRLKSGSPEEPFDKALRILRDPLSAVVYTVGCFILGLHLWHGFSSALQTIGLNHPRYWKLIRCVGIVFAVVIAAGFISFPVVFANLRH
jgi:succinate dehydrogenase / fumarate reductase, cytochrome b subunit